MLTKSPLVMRDVEIFERMAKGLPVSVNLSVPTLDEEAWRATEPHTPSPAARLDAVAELRRRGIDSGVLIAPLMPGINDDPEQVQPIVERAREAGATFLGGVALHLRGEVKDVFFAWLEDKRPDLLPRYEKPLRAAAPTCAPSSATARPARVRGWGRGRAEAARGREAAAPARDWPLDSGDSETPPPGRRSSSEARQDPAGASSQRRARSSRLPFVELRRTGTPAALCRPGTAWNRAPWRIRPAAAWS